MNTKTQIELVGKNLYLYIDYENKNIWMTKKEMAKLFNVDESTIRRLFKKKSIAMDNYNKINTKVCAKLPERGLDGKTYMVDHFNQYIIYEIGELINPTLVKTINEKINLLLGRSKGNIDNDLSLNNANNYEIVKYNNGEITISINVDYNEETVWLTQEEISSLFLVSKSTISYHISNIFNGKELDFNSVVRKIRTTGKDDKNYEMIYYNLDLILAVGYRVNSKRGIEFRRWASSIIKQHLLKGYSINEKRCLECSESIISLNNRVRELEMKSQKYNELLFGKNYELIIKGDIPSSIKTFDRIVNLSANNIKIIDRYIDDSVINFLEKYPNKSFIIYTSNKQLNDLKTNNITIKYGCNCHSRYIIVDDKYYYVYTCSLNSLDKNNYDIIFLDGIIIDDIFR